MSLFRTGVSTTVDRTSLPLRSATCSGCWCTWTRPSTRAGSRRRTRSTATPATNHPPPSSSGSSPGNERGREDTDIIDSFSSLDESKVTSRCFPRADKSIFIRFNSRLPLLTFGGCCFTPFPLFVSDNKYCRVRLRSASILTIILFHSVRLLTASTTSSWC